MTSTHEENHGLSATAQRMLALREEVMAEWEKRVLDAVDEARFLQHPILIDTLPAFYNNIAEAISPGHPRQLATEFTTIASEHGGERARLSNYKPQALIHEYQLLRRTILDVLPKHGVVLNEKEIEDIHRSVDAAIREAVAAFALVLAGLRERFFAALTHDMRNPLNVASVSTQLIIRSTDSALVKDLASKVVDNLERIDQMTQALLDSMTFKGGQRLQLELSHFDMLAVAKEVCEQASTVYGARFQIVGASVTGCWSRDAMKRVLENLVSNAAKYGAPDTPIRITLEKVDHRLMLSVHNEGEPIPSEETDSIFQIFARSNASRGGGQQGWGIGLPYVRSVAESHGGSIVVDSSAESGTTFVVDVPLDSRPFQSVPVLR